MALFWFWAIAAMLAMYAVLDGFDIGAGIIHLWVARSDRERRAVLRSIGPVWDGNEVWLLAAGGIIFMAFPTLYASSFSGFYLALMVVLWLLIMRGMSVEFRSHIQSPLWAQFWDVVFMSASAALAIFYGGAFGNVVRGVPLDAGGYFFLPLWTDFRVTGPVGILDWFTIMVGVATFLAMVQHGALWVAMKVEGVVEDRCRRLVNLEWWLVVLFTILIAATGPLVQPHLLARIAQHRWGYVFPAVAIAGLAGIRYFNRIETGGKAFAASCLYIVGIVGSTFFGLCPYLLPSTIQSSFGLSIHNAAAPAGSMEIAMVWFIPGMILAGIYFFIVYRSFAGKVQLEGEGY